MRVRLAGWFRFRRLGATLGVLLVGVLAGEAWLNNSYGVLAPWDAPRFIRACSLEYDYVSGSGGRISPGLVVSPFLFSIPPPIIGLSAGNPGQPYNGCPSWIALRTSAGDRTYLPKAAP